MPKCTIDGVEAEFSPGENLVEVAKRVGIEIPVFCYHPNLSVVAQCRMCAVEVEKMGKLQTACSTAATEGMVVKTQSESVKKNRASVMEFLLINHPLDCPICDKSGECDLQDSSFAYGDSYMRYTEERRTYVDLDMGPVIQKSMNRCIHCTRCIRFGDEVAGIREMVALKRGNNTEISTIDGRALETDYAGNYADICPTGSLTLKDFRFNKRVWMLKKTASVCEGCSRGCNMEIHHDSNVVQRCIPIENKEINQTWLCDEGRFHFRSTQNPDRLIHPFYSSSREDHLEQDAETIENQWNLALQIMHKNIQAAEKNQKESLILVGTDLTLEEVQAVKEFSEKTLKKHKLFHFGTPEINFSREDAEADKLLKRKSKTSNLHGIEKMGIPPFLRDTQKGLAPDSLIIFFTGGRAVVPDLSFFNTKMGVGVFDRHEIEKIKAEVVLPAVAFTEKTGTVVNFQGTSQKLNQAVSPPGSSKPIQEILMMLMNSFSKKSGAA